VFNSLLNLAHAISNAPAVSFQFFFARTTDADTPCSASCSTGASATALAAKSRHRRALARKPRQHVIQLRKFNLQLPFAAARMFRKNVQNELGAVNDPSFGHLFDVALLHG